MKSKTIEILDQLRQYIDADSYWLTRDDQASISIKIQELETFILTTYEKHEPKLD